MSDRSSENQPLRSEIYISVHNWCALCNYNVI